MSRIDAASKTFCDFGLLNSYLVTTTGLRSFMPERQEFWVRRKVIGQKGTVSHPAWLVTEPLIMGRPCRL